MLDENKRRELKATANEIRKWTLEMLENLSEGQFGGHIGGSMSIVDILTVLYFDQMNVDPKNPKWEDRDRFILSKGHSGPGLYSTLARRGFFDKEMLFTLNRPKTNLPSHCDMIRTPGIDQTCGSLGQGLSSGVGHALYAKMHDKSYKTYVVVGDGEIQEGQIWEAAMFAGSHKLNNLIVIVDHNSYQVGGHISEVMDYGDIAEKFAAFGFTVIDQVAGHDIDSVREAIVKARAVHDGPVCIVCNTIKGYGFLPAQDQRRVHNMPITRDEYLASCEYIDANL